MDDDVGRAAVAQVAGGAVGLVAALGGCGAVDCAGRVGGAGGRHQEGVPAVGGGFQIVGHAVTGGLQGSPSPGTHGVAPLVGVAGVGDAFLQRTAPDVFRNCTGVTSGTDAQRAVGEQMPVGADWSVGAAAPGIPDGEGALEPQDVAGLVQPVGAVAADRGALGRLEGLVRGDVLTENPCLEHGASFSVRGSVGETGDDDDDGGAVKHGGTFIKDPAVWVGHAGSR